MHHYWRNQYDGMKAEEAKGLTELAERSFREPGATEKCGIATWGRLQCFGALKRARIGRRNVTLGVSILMKTRFDGARSSGSGESSPRVPLQHDAPEARRLAGLLQAGLSALER